MAVAFTLLVLLDVFWCCTVVLCFCIFCVKVLWFALICWVLCWLDLLVSGFGFYGGLLLWVAFDLWFWLGCFSDGCYVLCDYWGLFIVLVLGYNGLGGLW